MIDLISKQELNEYILGLSSKIKIEAKKDDRFIYNLDREIVAVADYNKLPFKVSVRCDKELSKLLIEKYEEVIPGIDLNPKRWITIIITGQLSAQEIKDLILRSFELTKSIEN